MPVNVEKEDLRKVKTRRALYASLSSLLSTNSFEKMTVTDICEEALISRATFYTYFLDKYDLLRYWLIDLWSINENNYDSYSQLEKTINQYINENKSVLKNLIYEADNETIFVIFDFILSNLDWNSERKGNGQIYRKDVVLSNFYAGGIIFYLVWLVKNKFPADVQPMNTSIYKMLTKLQKMSLE